MLTGRLAVGLAAISSGAAASLARAADSLTAVQVLRAGFVEDALGAFEHGPERLDAVGADGLVDVLTAAVVDGTMPVAVDLEAAFLGGVGGHCRAAGSPWTSFRASGLECGSVLRDRS